jgi:hypothetical protein
MMLLQAFDAPYVVAGFLVGMLVGVTGVGGGSLMTPILILLFGTSPATAVGTDLLFAAATKTVGSLVHGYNRTIEWRIVFRLAAGSIPATALTLVLLATLHMSAGGARHLIVAVVALALLLTAVMLLSRGKVTAFAAPRLGRLDDATIAKLTVAMGAVLGVLVTLSSVGAGAIGVTVLVLLYPRVTTARIVGSDIAHAVPLTLLAGLGHATLGALDLHALAWLLAGSLPGILIGSLLSARVPDVALRYVLATVLFIVAGRMAVDVVAHTRPDVAVLSTVVAPRPGR